MFTGVWTAGETLGLALGPAVFALILALGGYRSSTGDDGGPAGIGPDRDHRRLLGRCRRSWSVLSLLALRGYRLTREEVA